jgi:hypothetical protein
MFRTVLRWTAWVAALVTVAIAGLVIADTLHQRDCRGSASHKGESYESIGERLTLLNTGHETNGEMLEIDVSFKPTAETNLLNGERFTSIPIKKNGSRSSQVSSASESGTGNRF